MRSAQLMTHPSSVCVVFSSSWIERCSGPEAIGDRVRIAVDGAARWVHVRGQLDGAGVQETFPDRDLSGVVEIGAVETRPSPRAPGYASRPTSAPRALPSRNRDRPLGGCGLHRCRPARGLGIQGALEQDLERVNERLTRGGGGPVEQRLGFLPGEAQAFESLTDGFTTDVALKLGLASRPPDA